MKVSRTVVAGLPPPGNDARGRCVNCEGGGVVQWDETGTAPTDCPDCRGSGRYVGLPQVLLRRPLDREATYGVFGKLETEVAARRVLDFCLEAGRWDRAVAYSDMEDGPYEKDGFVCMVAYGWLEPCGADLVVGQDDVEHWGGDIIWYPEAWKTAKFKGTELFVERMRARVLDPAVKRIYG